MSADSLRFDGRVAIVTGSGRGLGREYALSLGRLGAAIVVNSTKEATAQSTVEEINRVGGKAIAVIGSVADRAVADSMVKIAVENFGRIDIIINNAGSNITAYFEDASTSNLWDVFGVHVGGAWNVTQAAWPHMKKQKYGRVLMTTSLMMLGMAEQSIYGAAKMALLGLTKSISLEGKDHNIFVNSLAPSAFTDLAAQAVADKQLQILMERAMPVRDVAPPVLWLVHEDSKVNGEALSASGQIVTRFFLAETEGFQKPTNADWRMETIRDNWDKIVDERNYVIHTDMAVSGAALFERLSTQSGVSAEVVAGALQGKNS